MQKISLHVVIVLCCAMSLNMQAMQDNLPELRRQLKVMQLDLQEMHRRPASDPMPMPDGSYEAEPGLLEQMNGMKHNIAVLTGRIQELEDRKESAQFWQQLSRSQPQHLNR